MKRSLRAFVMSIILLVIVSNAQAQTLSSSPTITFSNSSGFGDNIAQDGEGGSVTISDFNIQVMPISNTGVKLMSDPLQYHDGTDWSGYPALITYGDVNPHFGWSIKSDNGQEFKLVSLNFLDWGEFSGATFTAEAFRNGSSLGSVNFPGNTSFTMVQLTNGVNLTSQFNDVDEVRIYKQDGADAWTGLNNIRVTTLVTLPVVLGNFSATHQGADVLLEWNTAMEQNSKDFVVQHNNENGSWSDLSVIRSAGNSNSPNHYSFLDVNPSQGMNHYRLLEHDMDGHSAYSVVAAIENEGQKEQLLIHPNPVVNGQLKVSVSSLSWIQIYNAMGIEVMETRMEPGSHLLNVNKLAKGVYYIRNGNLTAIFVIQ